MKSFLLSVVCLGGILIAGCDSGPATKTSEGQFSGPASVTKTETPGQTLEGQPASNTGILLPKGAPPEAAGTMQKGMGTTQPTSGGTGSGPAAPAKP